MSVCFKTGLILLLALLGYPGTVWSGSTRLPQASPGDRGMDPAVLAEMEPLIAQGIAGGQMPGCVVLIARRGAVVWLRAYGDRQREPERLPMTTDTVFDLASLTKPIATATSVLRLVDEGRLQLAEPVVTYWPEFGQRDKGRITIYQLLTHQSGLAAANALSDFRDGPQRMWERVAASGLRAAPGSRFLYSDIGYLVLGHVVERVSGESVAHFSQQQVFTALGLRETGYLPDAAFRERAAPSERREGRWLRGEVHDPRAAELDGVAGHAGLFSTAEELAVIAQWLLEGPASGRTILSERTIAAMTAGYPVPGGLRGLGWDVRSAYSSNRGQELSDQAFGHGGFTGTSLWVDPRDQLIVVFLSNRLHPDGKGAINRLARQIGSLAARAITDRPEPSVMTGIDVLHAENYQTLAGQRIGLITNHTGIDRQGVRTIDRLHQASDVELVRLFSPEHGLEGQLDQSQIADGRDVATELPVFSLYGATRKPTPESLQGLDTLVFDIQDIGTRFYTYISTMGLAMQAAAEQGLRFVVLDRPNVIGGRQVSGPMLDAGRESFVGFHPLPVRHGMTVGELAGLFRQELALELDLQVVRCEGWQRDQSFEQTGLPWVNPSPNMRSPRAAELYPGIGLLEMTNLSVGRGTEIPFEVLGAPWLDGARLAEHLNKLQLPGVYFVPISFTPTASRFRDELCGGIRILVTDRPAYRTIHTGLQIAVALRSMYPEIWHAAAYDRLLTNRVVHQAVLAGRTVAEIESLFAPSLAEFRERRPAYLLYE